MNKHDDDNVGIADPAEDAANAIVSRANEELLGMGRPDLIMGMRFDRRILVTIGGHENEVVCNIPRTRNPEKMMAKLQEAINEYMDFYRRQDDLMVPAPEIASISDAMPEGFTAEPASPVEPAEPASPVEPAEPTESASHVEPVEPAEPASPEETAEPSEPASPEETAEPSEPSEPAEPASPAETAETAEPAEPSETAETAEPVKPAKANNKLSKKRHTLKDLGQLSAELLSIVRDSSAHPSSPRKEMSWADRLVTALSRDINEANSKLNNVIEDAFDYDDVAFQVEVDKNAVYLMSGPTAVKTVSRRLPFREVCSVVHDSVWNAFDVIRETANRRRLELKNAEMLYNEGGAPLGEEAVAMVDAVRSAVDSVNSGFTMFADICKRVYGSEDGPFLDVDGFAGGVVISVAGRPAMSTHFPRVWSDATIKKNIQTIGNRIKAIGESVRKYLLELKKEFEIADGLRRAAKLQAEAEELVARYA